MKINKKHLYTIALYFTNLLFFSFNGYAVNNSCPLNPLDIFVLDIPDNTSICSSSQGLTIAVAIMDDSAIYPVTLSVSGLPVEATASFTLNPILPGNSTTLMINDAPMGDYNLTIIGDDGNYTTSTAITITLEPEIPNNSVGYISPAISAVGIELQPTFTWMAVPDADTYTLLVSNDPLLANLIINKSDITTTNHTTTLALNEFSTYYWKVIPSNNCGEGVVSTTGVFTTLSTIGIQLQMKVYLQGFYDVANQNMRSNLGATNQLPLTQPYSVSPWQYTGNETITNASMLPENIVDWVLVELRAANNPSVVVAQRAALLRNDGIVVDCNNTFSALLFDNLSSNDNYYVVLRHRNHLDVMSTTPLSPMAGLLACDFTIGIEQVYGNTLAILDETTGYTALCAGDIDGNGLITYLDFNIYLSNVNNTSAYQISDTNGDTQVTIADFNLYKANASQIGVVFLRY